MEAAVQATGTLAEMSPKRALEPGRSMLILLNPGKMSRYWLIGLANAAAGMGLRVVYLEIEQLRQAFTANSAGTTQEVNDFLIKHKVAVVMGYALNGVGDFPSDHGWPGAYRSFLEVRGIPHWFLWADHPQWVWQKGALVPSIQVAFRSGAQCHFLKSWAHAHELNRVLGWPNCVSLPMAADVTALKPAVGVEPKFDLVAVYGSNSTLGDWLLPFLEQSDPDVEQINDIVAQQCRTELSALWQSDAPEPLRPELEAWGNRAVEYKKADSSLALIRHLPKLTDEFPKSTWWLTALYPVYFKAAGILYKFRSWQRHFYLAYLSKYFRVGLFGGVWSHVNQPIGTSSTSQWVDFVQIPNVVAQGKVALDIVGGWDEEGLTAKTFELGACGAPMVHNPCVGLSAAFMPGKEMEVCATPLQARQSLQALLDNPQKRAAMGEACRARIVREHTWTHRISRMFELGGLPIDAFR